MHSRGLIRTLHRSIISFLLFNYYIKGQTCSDCADPQVDLSLCWPHESQVTFSIMRPHVPSCLGHHPQSLHNDIFTLLSGEDGTRVPVSILRS